MKPLKKILEIKKKRSKFLGKNRNKNMEIFEEKYQFRIIWINEREAAWFYEQFSWKFMSNCWKNRKSWMNEFYENSFLIKFLQYNNYWIPIDLQWFLILWVFFLDLLYKFIIFSYEVINLLQHLWIINYFLNKQIFHK